jgi:hypothetical protein
VSQLGTAVMATNIKRLTMDIGEVLLALGLSARLDDRQHR